MRAASRGTVVKAQHIDALGSRWGIRAGQVYPNEPAKAVLRCEIVAPTERVRSCRSYGSLTHISRLGAFTDRERMNIAPKHVMLAPSK